MKKVLLTFAIIIGVLVLVIVGALIKDYIGVDVEKKYKDLFDTTFEGNYTITPIEDNDSGFKLIKSKWKNYEITYYDIDGNERNMYLDTGRGSNDYSGSVIYSLMQYFFNHSYYLDYEVANAIAWESHEICRDQMKDVFVENFGNDLEYEGNTIIKGDGYEIEYGALNCGIYMYSAGKTDKLIMDKGEKEWISSMVSPETCIVLSKQDLKSYASNRLCTFTVRITVDDEKTAEGLYDKAEAVTTEYSNCSDYGGNYRLYVRQDGEIKPDAEVKYYYRKAVVFGKEVEFEDFTTEIAKANGIKDFKASRQTEEK